MPPLASPRRCASRSVRKAAYSSASAQALQRALCPPTGLRRVILSHYSIFVAGFRRLCETLRLQRGRRLPDEDSAKRSAKGNPSPRCEEGVIVQHVAEGNHPVRPSCLQGNHSILKRASLIGRFPCVQNLYEWDLEKT